LDRPACRCRPSERGEKGREGGEGGIEKAAEGTEVEGGGWKLGKHRESEYGFEAKGVVHLFDESNTATTGSGEERKKVDGR